MRRLPPARVEPSRLAVRLLIALTALVVLVGCGVTPPDDAIPTGPPVDAPHGGVECEYVVHNDAISKVDLPPMTGIPDEGTVQFTITTNYGDIVITTDRSATPCTVNSFASLVRQHFYDGTECFRLGDETMPLLQCGDPTGTGVGGPGYTIPDEVTGNETYAKGTVAMTNTGTPNSGGSQFFILYGDIDIPPTYTILGHTDAQGIAVVAKIAEDGNDGSFGDGTGHPFHTVTITTVTQDD